MKSHLLENKKSLLQSLFIRKKNLSAEQMHPLYLTMVSILPMSHLFLNNYNFVRELAQYKAKHKMCLQCCINILDHDISMFVQ